jgi:hypothetical protein
MAEDGNVTPLSRRVPGAARPGPGQSAKPVLSESVLHRMQAAIDAERGQAEPRQQGDPNTEPLPRVTASPGRRRAKRPLSPSGVGPPPEVVPDQDAESEDAATPARAADPPASEQPLRALKALRVPEPDWPPSDAQQQPTLVIAPRMASSGVR